MTSLLLTSNIGYAEPMPSFRCERATSFDERLVCSDEKAGTLDSKLTALYKLSLRIVGPGREIQRQQLNWVKTVRGKCTDLECISQAYSRRIEEILRLLDEHTRPIPEVVTGRIDYPASNSPYCRENPEVRDYFTVMMKRDASAISGYIDGVHDCGRKVWGAIEMHGHVVGNVADVEYEGGFAGKGWAKAFVLLKGNRLYWQIYQELRFESYEPKFEILKVTERDGPPNRVPPPIKWTPPTNDKEGVYDGERENEKTESVQ